MSDRKVTDLCRILFCVLIVLTANHYNSLVSGDDLFYDLNIDPNESDISLSSGSEYTDIYDNLVERSTYWADFVINNDDVDGTTKKRTWKANGGVSSWLVDDDFVPATIPAKYSYSDAPNIVFVLVDDWGWNDVGYRSTYMNWTTPTIDRLAAEGVKLENYFTSYSCIPARGALLTGRYPIRLGLWKAFDGSELPVSEITLGQEMQSAGYRTYMVGKWHLGFSTVQHTPAMRGFDASYTYWNGFVDYWTKSYGLYHDLHDGPDLVTDEGELSPDLHNGILMQTKAEAAIADHANNYSDQPMFLYYAMQLIHGVWSAPDSYLARCGVPTSIDDEYTRNVTYNYCALNVMLDEAVANLTCALETYGMADNTILVLVSDNGGEQSVAGNSYPFIGNKGSYFRGGLSGTGFVHSKMIPEAARGLPYYGQMHVTDWLPTLMGIATNKEWTGSLFGADLDGVDQWAAITTPGTDSPRSEILHFHDGTSVSSIQIDMMKLNLGDDLKLGSGPGFIFESDLEPLSSAQTCSDPSLMDDDSSTFNSSFESIDPATLTSSFLSSHFFGRNLLLITLFLVISIIVVVSIRLATKMEKKKSENTPNYPGRNESGNKNLQHERTLSETARLLI